VRLLTLGGEINSEINTFIYIYIFFTSRGVWFLIDLIGFLRTDSEKTFGFNIKEMTGAFINLHNDVLRFLLS